MLYQFTSKALPLSIPNIPHIYSTNKTENRNLFVEYFVSQKSLSSTSLYYYCMPKLTPDDFTVYEKLSNGKPTWSVLYRDAEGNRLSAISLPKLKKQLYTGKKRFEPIKDKAEAVLIAQKALNNPDLKDKLLNRKKPSSPNFIEYVNMVWDYKNSPYIKRRIKEKKPILEDTCKGNIKAFNDYVAPLISKKLTLKDIDKSKGSILTEIRDKVIDLDIHPTTKNKGFQAMRTALDYASQRSLLSNSYKDRLKNTKVEVDGTDPFTLDEINKIISYYSKHTEKGTYEMKLSKEEGI